MTPTIIALSVKMLVLQENIRLIKCTQDYVCKSSLELTEPVWQLVQSGTSFPTSGLCQHVLLGQCYCSLSPRGISMSLLGIQTHRHFELQVIVASSSTMPGPSYPIHLHSRYRQTVIVFCIAARKSREVSSDSKWHISAFSLYHLTLLATARTHSFIFMCPTERSSSYKTWYSRQHRTEATYLFTISYSTEKFRSWRDREMNLECPFFHYWANGGKRFRAVAARTHQQYNLGTHQWCSKDKMITYWCLWKVIREDEERNGEYAGTGIFEMMWNKSWYRWGENDSSNNTADADTTVTLSARPTPRDDHNHSANHSSGSEMMWNKSWYCWERTTLQTNNTATRRTPLHDFLPAQRDDHKIILQSSSTQDSCLVL